jgi:hypothetical protein
MTSLTEREDQTQQALVVSRSTSSHQGPDNTEVYLNIRVLEKKDNSPSARSQQPSTRARSAPPSAYNVGNPNRSSGPESLMVYDDEEPPRGWETLLEQDDSLYPYSGVEPDLIRWAEPPKRVTRSGFTTREKPVQSLRENYNTALEWFPEREKEITEQYSAYKGWNPAWAKE